MQSILLNFALCEMTREMLQYCSGQPIPGPDCTTIYLAIWEALSSAYREVRLCGCGMGVGWGRVHSWTWPIGEEGEG